MTKQILLVCGVALLAACGPGGTGGGSGGGSGGGPAASGASGFKTNPNGMSFQNYTNDGVTNLTAVEVRRFFGDGVCASMAGGSCTLTPAAGQWMEQANQMMNGGHCFGISHFTNLVHKGVLKAADYGGGSNAYDLMLTNNEALQREIAFWMATQLTAPANTSVQAARPTPGQLLNQLSTGWSKGESFTLAFFFRKGGGGHAVTPVAIRDGTGGKKELVIYDNNYPGMDRVITFDPSNDSWAYSTAANPAEGANDYDGDGTTKNIFAVPVADAQKPQTCTFCGDASPSMAMSSSRTVGAAGGGDLSISDGAGHSIGSQGDEVTNNFPGARANVAMSADLYRDNTEPQYEVPGGTDLKIELSGAKLTSLAQSEVSVIGPGYSLGVEKVALDPMQKDTLDVSAMGDRITYTTQGKESPIVTHGFSTPGADFAVAAAVASDSDGSAFTISRDSMTIKLKFSGAGATQFGFVIVRADAMKLQQFLHLGESLAGDATLVIDLMSWPGNGMPLTVGVDMGSDGTIDSTLQLTDNG